LEDEEKRRTARYAQNFDTTNLSTLLSKYGGEKGKREDGVDTLTEKRKNSFKENRSKSHMSLKSTSKKSKKKQKHSRKSTGLIHPLFFNSLTSQDLREPTQKIIQRKKCQVSSHVQKEHKNLIM